MIFTGGKVRGYGRVRIQGKLLLAHRVVLSEITGISITTKQLALHSCDNPSCINPLHLRWGTHSENNTECVSKGRHRAPRGGKSPRAKLTQAAVDYIRLRVETTEALAVKFGVSPSAVSRVLQGVTWNG